MRLNQTVSFDLSWNVILALRDAIKIHRSISPWNWYELFGHPKSPSAFTNAHTFPIRWILSDHYLHSIMSKIGIFYESNTFELWLATNASFVVQNNELFKLARHPNPRRHWENFLYSSPIQIQTHTTKWNSVLFCIFLHLFAYYWVAYDKNDCAMNIYLYVSVCLYLFIQFECSLFCKRLFRIEIKKKTNTEVSQKFCILRKIHRQDNRRKNESKRSKKKL